MSFITQILLVVACFIAFIHAIVLPGTVTPDCSSLADALNLTLSSARIFNSSFFDIATKNVAGVTNDVSFCEIYAVVTYGQNETMFLAMWLPDVTLYEDRFMAVGNTGFAGTIDLPGMMTQLNAGMGFAVAGSDAGHLQLLNGNGTTQPGVYLPFLHDPAQALAWIRDGVAAFTPTAKAIVAAFYGSQATYNYFDGCAIGGAQGFALAEYHPNLYDGIYAGCPANWYSHLILSFLWNAQATDTDGSQLSAGILNATDIAVLEQCDLLDGIADGILENPLDCPFNISTLACSTNFTQIRGSCYTAAQLTAVEAIFAGPSRSDNGSQIYPGFSFGSSSSWAIQEGVLADGITIPILQNFVFNNLSYDASTFDWASGVSIVDASVGGIIDAAGTNLTTFKASGGKLLVTQGWSDPYNAALWPIQQFEEIQDFFGGDVSDFYNLFMIPAGGHCGAASFYPYVPATYHTVSALVDWVERGEKPDEILTTNPPNGDNTTRKLCPWPATARLVESDINDWNSYVCE